jgi:23S rRNA (cytidine1920-2'-O)/16S rRNA (cytidine1409-2'-O)-methyltransferase
VGKHGIVRDPALYDIVQARVRAALLDLGLKVNAWMDSMIDGGDGNKEFFVHAVWAQPETVLARRAHIRQDREAAAAQALQDALDDY